MQERIATGVGPGGLDIAYENMGADDVRRSCSRWAPALKAANGRDMRSHFRSTAESPLRVALTALLLTGTIGCSSTAAMPAPPPADPPAVQPCRGEDIDVSAGSALSGATHRGVRVDFALTGDADRCLLTGYPGVYTSAGGPPQAHAASTPRGYLGGLPAGSDGLPTVLVTIGRPAHAIVEAAVVDETGQPCPTYDGLVVNPPRTTSIVLIPLPIQGCRFEVHPVTDDPPDSAGH